MSCPWSFMLKLESTHPELYKLSYHKSIIWYCEDGKYDKLLAIVVSLC